MKCYKSYQTYKNYHNLNQTFRQPSHQIWKVDHLILHFYLYDLSSHTIYTELLLGQVTLPFWPAKETHFEVFWKVKFLFLNWGLFDNLTYFILFMIFDIDNKNFTFFLPYRFLLNLIELLISVLKYFPSNLADQDQLNPLYLIIKRLKMISIFSSLKDISLSYVRHNINTKLPICCWQRLRISSSCRRLTESAGSWL